MLSEISKEAALTIVRDYDARMIFPYMHSEMSNELVNQLKVANKVVAVIEHGDPRQVALRIRQAVARKWLSYADEAKELLKEYIIAPMWDRQVKDFLEIYAAWYELKDDDSYADTLTRAEQLLSARKTLRDFKPNEPADLFGDIKSTLDGGRESVLRMGKLAGYRKLGIKHNEYLDAISLVKRLSHRLPSEESKHFKSVCEVAFRQFTGGLASRKEQSNAVESYFSEVKSLLSSKGVDISEFTSLASAYDFFYDNRIEEKLYELPLLADQKGMLHEEEYTVLNDEISIQLSELLSRQKIAPTSYYALLVGDGDRMGQCLRGMKHIEEHQQFTKELSAFAYQVEKDIQQDYSGQMIYSGGDDVMAILPVHQCLQAARHIRQLFIDHMKAAVSGELPRPTFSIGIAIVHMVEPLEESLQLARSAEKMAKERRNELALHFKKRNGSEELKVSLSFEGDPVGDVELLQKLFRAESLSSSFAYELRQLHMEYKSLAVNDVLPGPVLQGLIEKELLRVLLKKKPSTMSTEDTKAEIYTNILNIFNRLVERESETVQSVLGRLNHLAEQCVLALTLVREGDFYGTNH